MSRNEGAHVYAYVQMGAEDYTGVIEGPLVRVHVRLDCNKWHLITK